jgi:hypothetical protein
VGPTPDGCCDYVLRIERSKHATVIDVDTKTVPHNQALDYAAYVAALTTVQDDGSSWVPQKDGWSWQGLEIPPLAPGEIQGSSSFYTLLAKTLWGTVSRRSENLLGDATRIRVSSLINATNSSTPDPRLPFKKANKFLHPGQMAGWGTVEPTHISAGIKGAEAIRGTVAYGIKVLLHFENGIPQ